MDRHIQLIKDHMDANSGVYGALTDQQASDQFATEKTVKQPILSVDIYAYLAVIGKLVTLEESTEVAAKEAVSALKYISAFDVSVQANLDKLTQIIDDLVTVSIIVAADKTYILALGDKTTTDAEEIGVNPVRAGFIARARAA